MSVGRNAPCPCGSGRKYKQCHGVPAAAVPSATATAPLFREAQELLRRGDYAAAAGRYADILARNPEHADARHYLGMACCLQGRLNDGLAHLRASLALNPADAVYQNNIALWLEEAGDLDGAERHFLRALELRPDYRDARLNLARLLRRRRRNVAVRLLLDDHVRREPGDIEAGRYHAEALFRLGENAAMSGRYRDLLARAPHDHGLRLEYAERLQALGHMDEAVDQALAVLAADDDSVAARCFLAYLEERRNRLAEARHWAETALARAPGNTVARRLMARIARRSGEPQAALDWLDGTDPASMAVDERAHHEMERGTVLDQLGRYDQAFEAFRRGKQATREYLEHETGEVFYDPQRTGAAFARLERFFTRQRVAALLAHAPPPAVPAPIFIVGFPRSGTTLVEQMLAAHPQIHGGDELNALHLLETAAAARLASRLPYPDCLEAVLTPAGENALRELRDAYLAFAREAGAIDPARRWFTDKMPLNETRLGLVRLLFPASPVVHVVRHPLDVMLSCQANELLHGDNCALSLETAAFHYARVMELVERQVAELAPRYLRLRYEDVLADPEAELRRLLAFIGEPWDPACLEFHAGKRVARTASYAQVAKPLYRSSQERWRHYVAELEPVLPVLRPVMVRLGYDL